MILLLLNEEIENQQGLLILKAHLTIHHIDKFILFQFFKSTLMLDLSSRKNIFIEFI
jgi:hypothetical protein